MFSRAFSRSFAALWYSMCAKKVTPASAAAHMAAICAICKSQFTKVLPYYGMDMDQIVSVHQLVSNAIVLTGQKTEEDEEDEAEEVEV